MGAAGFKFEDDPSKEGKQSQEDVGVQTNIILLEKQTDSMSVQDKKPIRLLQCALQLQQTLLNPKNK